MILIILKIIIYYLLAGSVFTLVMCSEIDNLIDVMKNISEDDLSEIPSEKFRKPFVIMFTLLWPVFAYQIYQRNKL